MCLKWDKVVKKGVLKHVEERFEKEKAELIEGKGKEERQKTVSQEIDSTIFHLCDMIRNSKLLQHEMAENVLALASLVEARAKIINYFR